MNSNLTISLFGNPNCGKTAVFNLLTGLNQKVSNYPGITVEKKIAQFKNENEPILIIQDGELLETLYYGNSEVLNKLKYYLFFIQ